MQELLTDQGERVTAGVQAADAGAADTDEVDDTAGNTGCLLVPVALEKLAAAYADRQLASMPDKKVL